MAKGDYLFLVVFREHENHPCSRQEAKNPTKEEVAHRKWAKHACHRDRVVLMTKDLVEAIDATKLFNPFGWRSREFRDLNDMAHVFCVAEGKLDLKGQKSFFSSYLQMYGENAVWRKVWSDPMWKKAYERQVREAARAEKRFQRGVIKDIRQTISVLRRRARGLPPEEPHLRKAAK